jgi:hypothetical protein
MKNMLGKKAHFLYIRLIIIKKWIKSQVLRLNCESRVIFRIFRRHYLIRRNVTNLRSSYYVARCVHDEYANGEDK